MARYQTSNLLGIGLMICWQCCFRSHRCGRQVAALRDSHLLDDIHLRQAAVETGFGNFTGVFFAAWYGDLSNDCVTLGVGANHHYGAGRVIPDGRDCAGRALYFYACVCSCGRIGVGVV